MAEPLPHLRAQEVGKIGLAGPDCRHKGGPIGLFAEVSFFQPLGAGGVVGVDAHAGIDDGHQPDALRFQVGGELRKVRKPFLIYGKIGIVLHILDVHTDHVQRQVVLLVLACNLPHVLLGLVAPAALCQTECPPGRDELEIVDKARLDGYYVEHLSFGMDVKCFFGTIRAVLDHDGVVEGGTGTLHEEENHKK